MKSFPASLMLLLIITSFSCKHKETVQDIFNPGFSTLRSDSADPDAPVSKEETYYGVLTPVEICVIFNRLGVPYREAALNPISNADLYLSTSKAAINTGIYGVDFGYLKMFGIGQEVINYMLTIR